MHRSWCKRRPLLANPTFFFGDGLVGKLMSLIFVGLFDLSKGSSVYLLFPGNSSKSVAPSPMSSSGIVIFSIFNIILLYYFNVSSR